MKTDDLVTLLARGAGPAPRALVAQRVLPGALGGLAVAALVAALIGVVPPALMTSAAMLVKLSYAGALALAAAAWLSREARPAAPLRVAAVGVAGVLVALFLGAGAWLLAADPAQRGDLLMGQSWRSCPWLVALLSLPALALLLAALRQLAPTDLRRAGAAAGLLAGALGMGGYSLHCPEQSLAFVAVWYTLGVGLVTAAGAWLGPRVLRW